jgi:hypothetical protein
MRGATCGLLVAALLCPASTRAAGPADDLDDLVARLGSAKFKDRDAASVALEKHGAAALKALQAGARSADPEVRERASLLLRRIEAREEIARAIGGKKVRLVYDNTPVFDALLDFSAKAGVTIDVEGDRLEVRKRTITLNTGEATFWEALDQFCVKAELRERVTKTPPHAGRIALEDAKAAPLPTAYHGALRLRAVPAAKNAMAPPGSEPPPKNAAGSPPACVGFLLEVTAEPKLPWQGVVSLHVHRAVDEHGQALAQEETEYLGRMPDPFLPDGTASTILMAEDGRLPPPPRLLAARLQPGKRPALSLKEVHGTVTVQTMVARKVATIRDVAGCAGKDFNAPDGTSVRVLSAECKADKFVVTLAVRGPAPGRDGAPVKVFRTKNGVLVFGGPGDGAETAFVLTDDQGRKVTPTRVEQTVSDGDSGALEMCYTLTYPAAATAGPCTLTYTAPRPLTVDVPFTLRDVPLVNDPQTPLAPPGATPLILTR